MQQCSIFIYILAVSVCPCLPAAVVALDLLLGWGVKVLYWRYRSRHVEKAIWPCDTYDRKVNY